MLIVSKFYDYYDVGMKSGVDKTCVYDRKTFQVSSVSSSETSETSGEWYGSVLAFCGKFYPFVYYVGNNGIDNCIWSVEEAISTLAFKKHRYSWWDEYNITTEMGIKKFFDKKYPELEELFFEHRTPIFLFKPVLGRIYSWKPDKYKSLVVNPCLKDIKFYKIKSPIEAYQDIFMYLSGVIGAPPRELIEVSDEVKAASHGHDSEYSFRKPPGKRGKNRWR